MHRGTALPGRNTAKMKSKDQILEELNRRLHHYNSVGPESATDPLNPYDSPSKLPLALPMLSALEKENNSDQRLTADKAMSKLPVPEKRQKKRSALTKKKGGVTLSGLQPVSISRYRPDYTWNRGGRVKELRIRTVGRKFLHIWIAKVYGRVSPAVAREHYNQKQLRRAYTAWREVWWTNVREWRLMVRAECQHRYVLWSRVFKAWKLFVEQKKLQHNQEAAAQNIGNRRLLSQTFSAWKEHHRNKQIKERKKAAALRFNEESIVRKVWLVWTEKLLTQRRHQQMEAVSLQFWAYRIQLQHWLLWRDAFQDRVGESVRLQQATRLYNNALKSRCLHAMLAYAQVRKFKKNRKDFAQRVYASSALARCFSQWCDSLMLRRSLAEHQNKMIQLARRFSMRKAVTQWKSYVAGKRRDRERREVADIHYLKHLLMMGLNGLRLGLVRRGIKDTRKIIAQDFHRNQMLKLSWLCWVQRCEEREEMQTLPQSQRARHHHRMVILRRCFDILVQYRNKKQQQQALTLKADAFFYWKSLPKYFFKMRVFVQIMQNKEEDQQKAKAFRRENLLARFFYHWFVESENSQNCRMAERMAILHYNGRLGLRFLLLWRRKTVEAYELREKEAVAAGHHNQTLLKNTVKQWRYIVQKQKISRNHELKACRHRYMQQVKQALRAWKEFHKQRLAKKIKVQTALSHYQRRHCQQAVDTWKRFVTQQQQRKAVAENMYQEKCADLKRLVLRRWRDNVTSLREEKECEQKAEIHRNQHLLAKVVKTWHRFAAIHAYKKSETQHLVEQGRKTIEWGIMKRVFQRWREARDESLVARLKYEQAVQHRQTSLKIQALGLWKDYAKLSLRKKLLSRQACWFRQTVVQSQCWLRWRFAYSQALETHSQTNLALWHWSLSLQRNMLVRWWEYVQSRKQKKLRYAEALEKRRSRLLKSGVTQWLKVAGEFTQMRAKFAAQKHTKSAYDSFQLVQKYALHWKQMTAKRKSSHPSSALPESTSRLLPVSVARKTVTMVPTVSFSPIRVTGHVGSRPLPAHQESDSARVCEPVRAVRPRPRRPDFLIASLKREGLLSISMEQSVSDQNPTTRTTDDVALAGRGTLHEDGSQPAVPNPPMHPVHLPTGKDKYETAEKACEAEPENYDFLGYIPAMSSLNPTGSYQTVTEARKPSASVAEKVASFMPDEKSRPVEPSSRVKNNLDCGASKLTLITPETFLTRKDGTPILEPQGEVDTDPQAPPYLANNADSAGMPLQLCTSDRSNTVEHPEPVPVLQPDAAYQRQAEIIQIRDRLKMFDHRKKTLKELKGQWKQLCSWLSEQSSTEGTLDDTDSVRQEIQQMEEEMCSLKAQLGEEKPRCAQLVERVRYLIQLQKQCAVTAHNSDV